LKKKLIKIGAKAVSHGRYVAFQMAEFAISRHLFADILRLIAQSTGSCGPAGVRRSVPLAATPRGSRRAGQVSEHARWNSNCAFYAGKPLADN
jgi:hypothetical protein